MNKSQESKYYIQCGVAIQELIQQGGVEAPRLANRKTFEPIPDDEPVFILRARDIHAVETLREYLRLCNAGSTVDRNHLDAVHARLKQFRDWVWKHPERMKVPDTDKSLILK